MTEFIKFDDKLTPKQKEVKQAAHELGDEIRPKVAEWDKANYAPMNELNKKAREKGLTGITIPAKYGGQDLSVVEYVIAVEELTRVAQFATASEILFRTSGPGPSTCMLSDNEDAKNRFLPRIVSGQTGASIAITEPRHGSDMSNLETTAIADGADFIVNGHKRYITGCTEDEIYSTFVRFGKTPGVKGIGAVMIEKGTPGVQILKGAEFLGTRGMPHGEIIMTNVRVPKKNLLIAEGQFSRLMTAFNMERMHNCGLGLAIAEAAFDEVKKYVLTRKQFGTEVINFQVIQHSLADMWITIEAIRALTYRAAATAIDGKYPRGLEVTVAKAFENATVPSLCQKALLMHGGDGFTVAYPISRILRDSLALPLGGGTLEMLKNMIAQWIVPEMKLERPRGGD